MAGATSTDSIHVATDADRAHAGRAVPEAPRERGAASLSADAVPAIGLVEPHGEITELSTAEVGTVQRVLVSEGDRVLPGQLAAQLDDAVQQASLVEAQAALRLAELRRKRLGNGARAEEFTRARASAAGTAGDSRFPQASLHRFRTLDSNGATSKEALERATYEAETKAAL